MSEEAEEVVFQGLGACFCHDLASPINASGLIWEALEGSLTTHENRLAQQNQESLLTLLEFYRIFFANRPPQHLFSRALNLLKTIGKQQQLLLVLDSQLEDLDDTLGKILALIIYMFRGNLQSGDAILLEPMPRGLFSLKLKTKTMLPYQDLHRVLETTNEDQKLSREHFRTHCYLLKEVLKRNGQRLQLIPSAGLLECLLT